MSTLKLDQIKKKYGETEVIPSLSLDIETGEFVVLVGPSGCGKSTTLRMIAGLEEITDGELYIQDRKVNEIRPSERGVAMVFQDYALYPHMSVYQNMAFGLKLQKLSKKEISERIDRVAKLLDLTDYLERKPSALSGGQRQRVAMGRAVVKNSNIFLYDEPLSNLDAKLRSRMRGEIKRFHLENRSTSIYVTHDQLEAMTLADKLVVMNKGEIQQIGTPLEIYERPINVFVATFIGGPSMNILDAKFNEGKVQDKNGLLNIEFPNLPTDLLLGVRPEDFVIDPNSNITAEVLMVELLGKKAYITLKLDSNEEIIVEKDHLPFPNILDRVGIKIHDQRVHLFDKNSETRLN